MKFAQETHQSVNKIKNLSRWSNEVVYNKCSQRGGVWGGQETDFKMKADNG